MMRRPGFSPETAARQQRERLFQLGLFVCLIMVMLDGRTNRSPPPSSSSVSPSSSATRSGEESTYLRLKSVLSSQRGDGHIYPMNVSGRYHGNWTRKPANKTALSSIKAHKDSEKGSTRAQFKLTSLKGHFAMQVYQEPLEGLSELSLVRGYFQLIGADEPLRHQASRPCNTPCNAPARGPNL